MMNKQNKQSQSNNDFTLDKLKKTKEKFNPKNTKTKAGYSAFNIRCPLNIIKDFHNLMFDFQKKTLYYKNFSKNTFFSIAVKFFADKFSAEKSFVKAPDDYIEFVSRKGSKGTENPRTAKGIETGNLFIKVDHNTAKLYFDIMHSFMVKKGDNPYYYSPPYFFYDFVELIKKNLKEIVKQYKK